MLWKVLERVYNLRSYSISFKYAAFCETSLNWFKIFNILLQYFAILKVYFRIKKYGYWHIDHMAWFNCPDKYMQPRINYLIISKDCQLVSSRSSRQVNRREVGGACFLWSVDQNFLLRNSQKTSKGTGRAQCDVKSYFLPYKHNTFENRFDFSRFISYFQIWLNNLLLEIRKAGKRSGDRILELDREINPIWNVLQDSKQARKPWCYSSRNYAHPAG